MAMTLQNNITDTPVVVKDCLYQCTSALANYSVYLQQVLPVVNQQFTIEEQEQVNECQDQLAYWDALIKPGLGVMIEYIKKQEKVFQDQLLLPNGLACALEYADNYSELISSVRADVETFAQKLEAQGLLIKAFEQQAFTQCKAINKRAAGFKAGMKSMNDLAVQMYHAMMHLDQARGKVQELLNWWVCLENMVLSLHERLLEARQQSTKVALASLCWQAMQTYCTDKKQQQPMGGPSLLELVAAA